MKGLTKREMEAATYTIFIIDIVQGCGWQGYKIDHEKKSAGDKVLDEYDVMDLNTTTLVENMIVLSKSQAKKTRIVRF